MTAVAASLDSTLVRKELANRPSSTIGRGTGYARGLTLAPLPYIRRGPWSCWRRFDHEAIGFGPNADVVTHLGIRPLSEANGHPADILGPSHRLTITLQGEGARYFNPAADIALPTTQGISAVACPPTAAATQPSDNAV